MKIKNSVIVITGASAGIGLACARLLGDANHGATVVLAARSEQKLKELEKEIPNSLAVVTDMRKPADISRLIKVVLEKYGKIDIFINNAAQGLMCPVEKINLDDYQQIIELNIFAVIRSMQGVIPIMRRQGKGMILNISSLVSKNYFPELSAYASTKYALNAISLTAREELKKDNIIVSVFHPKLTATDFGKNTLGEKYSWTEEAYHMEVDTAEAVAGAIARQIESEDSEARM
jgi:NADP-dependent 3-hydroxy acid dehydrogenase YdfG